jgi:hypothetical protein
MTRVAIPEVKDTLRPVHDVVGVEVTGGVAAGKRHPRSRACNARRCRALGSRRRRPASSGEPSGPSTTSVMPASQASRRNVAADIVRVRPVLDHTGT